MPVAITRDAEGAIHAFESRCAHRGAFLCLKPCGEAREIACVYHNWTYDLKGNLTAVAFRRGIKGSGGMLPDARPESNSPRQLKIENYHGLVFGTLAMDLAPVADYLGEAVAAKVRRVMKGPVKALGGYSQMLPNNWKLYMENVKDTYHASLLHLFFTTFRINRLSQRGGVIVGGDGGCHVSYTVTDAAMSDEYEKAGMRSAASGFALEAPEVLDSVDENGDGISVQIVGVFPGFVLQQIKNCLAVRRIAPRGLESTELFWTAFGYVDDDQARTAMRLKQANLIGPSGYISMEDGAATGFVQRGTSAAGDHAAVVEMGGRDVASNQSRVTETSVRGFWQAWRARMDL